MRSNPVRCSALVIAAVFWFAACGSTATSTGIAGPSSTAVGFPRSQPAATSTPNPSPSVVSQLVGQWSLDKTCAMIVDALTKAGRTDLIALDVPELLKGSVDDALPEDYDPAHPCADALPPTEHSHTFWPDGSFNSYDQNGQQVDDGPYRLVDDHTFSIGEPVPMLFHFTVTGDSIAFDVVIPTSCTSEDCIHELAWAFSVANPGQTWTRVTTGPHVP